MAHSAYAEGTRAGSHAPLTACQVSLIRTSFLQIEPARDLVASLFFRRLEEIAPEMRPLLKGSEARRHRQLIMTLALAVASLERFGDIEPMLEALGARYRAQGIAETHYGAVAEAMLWTLSHSLGPAWTAPLDDAWTALITLVAETMTGR